MKKNALAILALVACALAGCTKPTSTASSDSTNPSSSSSTSTSFSGDDVTTAGAKEIQFWHCIGHEKMTNLKVIIDKFNDAHSKTDGYYVKAYQIAGEYTALHDAVKTKLSAGFVPSITMGYPDSFAEYIGTNGADKSTILNLESQIAADTTFDAAGMVPQFYTEGQDYQYTGTWSVPLYKSTEIMYYNKTMFEASAFYKAHKDETYGTYGAKLGDPKTWDWDTLVYVAGQIQSENSGVSDFHALGYDSDANLFISQMAQRSIPYTTKDGKGAGHFLFVDTATGKANQALVDFTTNIYNLTKAGTMVTQGSYGTYASTLFKQKKVMFTVGSTAGSSYNEPNGAFQCGLAPVPCYQANKKQIMQGPSLCFFNTKDTAKEKAAWEFYSKYVSDAELNAGLSLENSYDPVRTASYETDGYKEYVSMGLTSAGEDDITKELIYRIPSYTKNLKSTYMTSPVFIGSSTSRVEIGKLISYTKENSGDVSAAIIKAYTNCVLASNENA
jgi:multiple sugar transport system substrate-binding protein